MMYNLSVITVKLKLPNKTKQEILEEYTEEFSRCVRWYLERIQEDKTTSRKKLHRSYYHHSRKEFNLLSAQIPRAMDKAIEMQRSFLRKKGKKSLPKLNGKFACFRADTYRFTDKALIVHFSNHRVVNLPYHIAPKYKPLLFLKHGRGELVRANGYWYFHVPIEVPKAEPIKYQAVIGIDLGLAKLATTSKPVKFFRGNQARFISNHYSQKRAELQSKNANGSKNAYKVLKRLSGKEARWMRDMNHKISRSIVNLAVETKSAIALENLEGIRGRLKAPKRVRRMLHSWSFRQLADFITYKSQLAGVPCVMVDPRHTSTRCPKCGYIDRGNRKRQSEFRCKGCGYSANADFVAATNIAGLGSLSLGYMLGEKGGRGATSYRFGL